MVHNYGLRINKVHIIIICWTLKTFAKWIFQKIFWLDFPSFVSVWLECREFYFQRKIISLLMIVNQKI